MLAQKRQPQINISECRCCRHTFYSGFLLGTNTEHTVVTTRELKLLIPRLFVFPSGRVGVTRVSKKLDTVNTAQVRDNRFLCTYILYWGTVACLFSQNFFCNVCTYILFYLSADPSFYIKTTARIKLRIFKEAMRLEGDWTLNL